MQPTEVDDGLADLRLLVATVDAQISLAMLSGAAPISPEKESPGAITSESNRPTTPSAISRESSRNKKLLEPPEVESSSRVASDAKPIPHLWGEGLLPLDAVRGASDTGSRGRGSRVSPGGAYSSAKLSTAASRPDHVESRHGGGFDRKPRDSTESSPDRSPGWSGSARKGGTPRKGMRKRGNSHRAASPDPAWLSGDDAKRGAGKHSSKHSFVEEDRPATDSLFRPLRPVTGQYTVDRSHMEVETGQDDSDYEAEEADPEEEAHRQSPNRQAAHRHPEEPHATGIRGTLMRIRSSMFPSRPPSAPSPPSARSPDIEEGFSLTPLKPSKTRLPSMLGAGLALGLRGGAGSGGGKGSPAAAPARGRRNSLMRQLSGNFSKVAE
ncbi:hypothetical protein T484DRAFT_1886452, partial [Baffinella frigidus]